jgi:hypothetical protein
MHAWFQLRSTRFGAANGFRRTFIAALLSGWLANPAAAQAGDFLLRFLPPEGADVERYTVYVTDLASAFEEALDVGWVPPDADGVARTTIWLDAARAYRLEMTAVNSAGESGRSNAIDVPAVTSVCDPSLCDDGNPCTEEGCDAAGCFSQWLPDGSACDDAYIDTVDDACVQGVCQGVLLACRGDLDCDDGNVCNGFEVCDGGTVCLEGIPLDCGEPTACTAPRCDAVEGCLTEFRPNGLPCDDGLADTYDDVCWNGVCRGISSGSTPVPALAVEGVSPETVSPGSWTLTIYGQGFAPGATLKFPGKGRAPEVHSLSLLDDHTLEALVSFSSKGPKYSHQLDVQVALPDGTQAVLDGALRMNP